MLATRFDDVFLVPVVIRAPRTVERWRNCTIEDLEFSDLGRSPRQGIGSVVLALACFWTIVAVLIAV